MQEFAFNLENNIFELHNELKQKIWKPDPYIAFFVRDPKLRHIHKASIRDRIFNQAMYRVLYQIFDKGFIADSYSCRKNKGTHKGVEKLKSNILKISNNHTKEAFALKCDVRKFFDNKDHEILFSFIRRKITDLDVLSLIRMIIESFETKPGVGLPLGNVTSQLFANIYLNELDQYIKHIIKTKYYLRYCDDFIIIDSNKDVLCKHIKNIGIFLYEKLHLFLHPQKVNIRKCNQGIDFLGYVALPKRTILRTKTKNRILKKIIFANHHAVQSYLGILKHCNGYKIQKKLKRESIADKS
ncbi:MAG: reverse transcriptase domain-containing protein [bacterium]